MKLRPTHICILVLAGSLAIAADVPVSLQAPSGQKLVLRAHASGSQIYTCGLDAAGKPQWTLKGPDADLRNGKAELIGHHSIGPTWRHRDGSEVTAKAIAHVDSPDPGSIPWLLLTATGHSGTGAFAAVESIQRLHTRGGQPPAATECDASRASREARSSYTADYYFFAPAR